MPLSTLAAAIYEVLQPMVPSRTAEITYSNLVEAIGPLPPPNVGLRARDPRLDKALEEIVHACYAHKPKLAPLSALVVRKDPGALVQMPGGGYFNAAHPGMTDNAEQLAAWGLDIEEVRRTTYPAAL